MAKIYNKIHIWAPTILSLVTIIGLILGVFRRIHQFLTNFLYLSSTKTLIIEIIFYSILIAVVLYLACFHSFFRKVRFIKNITNDEKQLLQKYIDKSISTMSVGPLHKDFAIRLEKNGILYYSKETNTFNIDKRIFKYLRKGKYLLKI